MGRLKDFIIECKRIHQANRLNVGRSAKVTYVCGNEAGDLDSVMSALSYAYLKGPGYIPFVNIPKIEVLQMRGEILHVLSGYDLIPDDLLILDDVFGCVNDDGSGGEIKCVFVDHNEPSGRWQRRYPNVKYTVLGIIDHHEDGGHNLNVSPRLIQQCGSCCSLITKYFANGADDRLKELSKGLLQTILIDTVKLTWRQTQEDINMAAFLSDLCDHDGPGYDSLFVQLDHALNAIPESSFGIYELLHKDYKLYSHQGDCNQSKMMYYGMSTIHVPFQHFLTSDEGFFTESVWKYIGEEHLSVFLMINSVREPGDTCHYQQTAIFSADHTLTAVIRDHLNRHGCQLKVIREGDGFGLYEQENTLISRKQIHPFIKDFMKQQQQPSHRRLVL